VFATQTPLGILEGRGEDGTGPSQMVKIGVDPVYSGFAQFTDSSARPRFSSFAINPYSSTWSLIPSLRFMPLKTLPTSSSALRRVQPVLHGDCFHFKVDEARRTHSFDRADDNETIMQKSYLLFSKRVILYSVEDVKPIWIKPKLPPQKKVVGHGYLHS
jgi:hypothetical protein